MSMEKELQQRSSNKCELCGNQENLSEYNVPDIKENGLHTALYACNTCTDQMQDWNKIDANHWRCLNDSMWSEHDAVKIMAWRMLNRIKADWPQNLLDMMYLDGEVLELAKASGDGEDDENKIITEMLMGSF